MVSRMKELQIYNRSTRESQLPAKSFYAAINENTWSRLIALNDENAGTKYKDTMTSKIPVVVLTDCIKADKTVGKHIPLKYKNADNKLNETDDKEGKAIQDCKGHTSISSYVSKTSSKDSKIKKPLRNKKTLARKSIQNKLNIVNKGASTCDLWKIESAGDTKAMALEGGKRLRVLLKRVKVYDKNPNTTEVNNDVESLRVNNLLESQQDESNSIKSSLITGTDTEHVLPEKEENITLKEQIIQDDIVEEKSSEKRARIISDVYNVSAKKIKLYKSHQVYNAEAESKKINKRNYTAKCAIVTESSTKESISEIKVINTVNAVAQNIKTLDVESVSDNSISRSARKDKSFGNVNKPDCYSERYTVQNATGVATSEAAGSSQQTCSTTSNSMEEEIADTEDEKSDCISLFADSALIEECDSYISDDDSHIEKPYGMSNDVFENYYKRTVAEFDNIYDSSNIINENNHLKVAEKSASKSKQSTTKLKESTSKSKKYTLEAHLSKMKQKVMCSERVDLYGTVFLGYCYTPILTGKNCVKRECRYRHDFSRLLTRLYQNDPQFLYKVLEELAWRNRAQFVLNCYFKLLMDFPKYCDISSLLNIFKKLHELKMVTIEVAYSTMDCLEGNGYSMKAIIAEIAAIVSNADIIFMDWILRILTKSIGHGEYWETFKCLLLKFDCLHPRTVEAILEECIITEKHIHDVNANIIRKMRSSTFYPQINRRLLSSFENLVKQADKICSSNKSSGSQTNLRVLDTKENRTPERKEKIDQNTQNENSGLALHPTDGSVGQCIVHGRSGLGKSSNNDVRSLQEGLKHNDYKHVVNILNSGNGDQRTFLTRACYESLSKEILRSPDQLTNLALQAVQVGATSVFYQIIVDVAIPILINLAKKKLWVLAYRLFKDIRIILKVYILLGKFDAATIMLFAEIYLANLEAMKAFALLKKTNIIFTDPTRWKVKSNKKDPSIRVQVITLLVDALCEASPEYAFYLFEFLVIDQYSNFHPIDLVRLANKMISTFLAKKNDELITNIGKLIVRYNFILDTTIYRALVSELVRVNMDLAKRLYQIAIGLGIYSKVQFFPTTHLIVNSNWTKEEMYLAILTLMEELASHIGVAIEHIQPEEFSVYLIFENVPLNHQVTCTNEQNDERFKEMKDSMNSLLCKQFDPPILAIKEDNGKIHKLDSSSVLRHLKSVYA